MTRSIVYFPFSAFTCFLVFLLSACDKEAKTDDCPPTLDGLAFFLFDAQNGGDPFSEPGKRFERDSMKVHGIKANGELSQYLI